MNVKLEEADIADKLADASDSFGSGFDMVEEGMGALTRVGMA